MQIPVLGGAYEGRSSNVSPQTCINLFYEKAKDGECLVGTPGATLFSNIGGGEVRGGIEYNGRAFFVVGDTLYEVNDAGTATSRGTLLTTKGRVSIAHNGYRPGANQQIMIVDGKYGYIYDFPNATLTQITDTDFKEPSSVVFIDGYFIYSETDTDRFYLSSSYDGTAYDAADLYTAEGWPDRIKTLIADRRELFVFGEETLEVWYNSGDVDNTFQRFQGGFVQTGCAAAFSPAKIDNNIYWLTQNDRGNALVAMMGNGYQPQIVSTPEVAYQMSTYSRVDDAFSYVYQDEGHEFYVLTFPTAKATWVFDSATKEWHQRAHVINSEFPNRERYNCHVFCFGKHLVGDFEDGKIYALDTSVGTLNGTRIPRERKTANITSEERRIRIAEVQLDMEEGTGSSNTSNDADVWVSYSKDGGHTYSDEIAGSWGDEGEYSTRVIWRRLGLGRNWIFRFRTWSPNRVLIKGAYARIFGNRNA